MKRFVLHDGEDDKKTEELHQFMEGAKIHEWEGCNDGILIYPDKDADFENERILGVSVGDTIVIDDEGNVTVEKKR